MKAKHDILNKLIEENNCESYLELGYGMGHNFNRINCKEKYSVDVNGKADFNEGDLAFFEQNEKEYQAIFIDSLHHADHVREVIIQAFKLNPKFIALHDTLPKDKRMTIIPRKQEQWTGDVFRAAVGFHKEYPELGFVTYRSDYGLTVIYPDGKKIRKHFEDTEISFEYFQKNAKELINIID